MARAPKTKTAPPAADGPEDNIDRLRKKLRELFQLDRGDLDFGLYRIMAMKRTEVGDFLNDELLPQIKEALGDIAESDTAKFEADIKKATQAARDLGLDPNDSPTIDTLKEQKKAAKSDQQTEAETYNHIYNFFARYYDEGDFMSLRRYKSAGKEAYSIPYNGEEVKLHWANADQYYIKTTENYSSYIFTVGKGKAARRVRFEIAAADNEKDNIKETNGKNRLFILSKDFMQEKEAARAADCDLIIRFDHRPLNEGEKARYPKNGAGKQKEINKDTEQRIGKKLSADWQSLLFTGCPTEADEERTLLGKHITTYTSKNSFDYFIHKDLGGFLRRELDFYLKSEVLSIDNLELADDPAVFIRSLAQIKAIKCVGGKIIDFLAQLEDFQKQLWLKKKFVLETQYCVTLDKVSESLYPEIIKNKAQNEEWVRLFAIDELKGDAVATAYSKPLKTKFLKENPYLVLDTRHFDEGFKDILLAALSEAEPIEEQMNGLLVYGENFQALNLLREMYKNKVKCIYIDPPYNTEKDDFIYKDSYKHSSWITLLDSRIELGKKFLLENGLFMSSIDEHETTRLRELCQHHFGHAAFAADLIWNTQHSQQSGLFAPYHEYVQVYANKPAKDLDNFLGGKGTIVAGALKKPSAGNPPSDFKFPAGVPWEASDGTEIKGRWGKAEVVELVSGRMVCDGGKTKFPITLRAGWTQKRQMEQFFSGQNFPVIDTKGQEVTGFFFSSTGKLKITKKRSRITPNTILPLFGTVSKATAELTTMFNEEVFGRPKPTPMIEHLIDLPTDGENRELVMDFFAGSGTTGHAVVNLNRKDLGSREYILIEVDRHFKDVLLPRMKKVVYSEEWKNGKPTDRKGVSQLFKYIRIESYEDALDSLTVNDLKDAVSKAEEKEFIKDYKLRYALSEETAENATLLGKYFIDPSKYMLTVVRDGIRQDVSADIAETFNFLLGLRLASRQRIEDVLAITGETAKGENCLILWRNTETMNAKKLEKWFTKHRKIFGKNLNLIYVNGDHTLNAPKNPAEKWEAVSTEPVFRELMFGGNV